MLISEQQSLSEDWWIDSKFRPIFSTKKRPKKNPFLGITCEPSHQQKVAAPKNQRLENSKRWFWKQGDSFLDYGHFWVSMLKFLGGDI